MYLQKLKQCEWNEIYKILCIVFWNWTKGRVSEYNVMYDRIMYDKESTADGSCFGASNYHAVAQSTFYSEAMFYRWHELIAWF